MIPAVLDAADVIVHPADLDMDFLSLTNVERRILIDWELDPVSASTFAGRAAAVLSP